MISVSHMTIGGALGVAAAAIIGPGAHPATLAASALAVGIVSHFVCDSIPHWDHPVAPIVDGELVWTKQVYIFAYADSIIAGLLTLSLWGFIFHFNPLSPFIWGAAGGYLPDFLDNVPYWKKYVRKLKFFTKFHQFHEWVHSNWEKYYPMPKYWKLGLATQLLVGIPLLLYVLMQ